VQEYFISTHGSRKGLADTALKTADAGYLTRRLVDVTQSVTVTEHDCGTLRGISVGALKDNEEVVAPLSDRIEGRVSVHDVYDPHTDELIVEANELITEEIADRIAETSIEEVEIRSVLTCEAKRGVCTLCYGENLATGRMVDVGESIGVVAAQSIGEPGTQLTLRTFHTGGTATRESAESTIQAKFEGVLEFENLRTVTYEDTDGSKRLSSRARERSGLWTPKRTGENLPAMWFRTVPSLPWRKARRSKKGMSLPAGTRTTVSSSRRPAERCALRT